MGLDKLVKGSKLVGHLLKLAGVVKAADANIDTMQIRAQCLISRIEKLSELIDKQSGIGKDIEEFKSVTCDMGAKVVQVFGGPYLDKPVDAVGIKLAAEIKASCHVALDIVDFNVPTQADARRAVVKALVLLDAHGDIYAGCMGGVGRTGLFLALMVKTLEDLPGTDAIQVVRDHFNIHAIETKEQEAFVIAFDTRRLQKIIKDLNLFK